MFKEIENEKIESIKIIVTKYFRDDSSGHDIAHIERTANVAQKIAGKIMERKCIQAI